MVSYNPKHRDKIYNLRNTHLEDEVTEISKFEAFVISANCDPNKISDFDRQVMNRVISESVESDVKNNSYSPKINLTYEEKEVFERNKE